MAITRALVSPFILEGYGPRPNEDFDPTLPIGKWAASDSVIGDLTGGNIRFDLGPSTGIESRHRMWSVEGVQVTNQDATSRVFEIELVTQERGPGGVVLPPLVSSLATVAGVTEAGAGIGSHTNGSSSDFRGYRFHDPNLPWVITVRTPNVNLINFEIRAWGFIFVAEAKRFQPRLWLPR